jgi:polyribonucleotide nucleotidyltransferase
LSCVHIRASNANSVASALKLLIEKKEESSKLIHVIELQPDEAWIVPKILGKGGGTINNIRKSTGCKIDLMKDELTITLSGEDKEREMAKELLEEVISKARKECHFVSFPVGAMNAFIGKGGANIKQVQEDNDVIIDCERDRSTVRITGKEEAVSKAVKAISVWVEQWEEENSTKTLHVKESMLAAIVGKGGSVINLIQQETGCKVNIDRASSSVTIKGSLREIAAQRIQAIIEHEILEQKARAADKERQLKEAQEAEKERLRLIEEQSSLLSATTSLDGDEKKDEVCSVRVSPVGMSHSIASEEVLKPDPFVTPAGQDLFNFLMSDTIDYESDVIEKLIYNGSSKHGYGDSFAKGGMPSDDTESGSFFISSSGVFIRL